MYMLAFVTLMVALIGMYAQIYTKQATAALANQTGLVDTMLTWHGTAVALATSLVPKIILAAPCSLTQTAIAGSGIPSCKYNAGANDAYVGMSPVATPPYQCNNSSSVPGAPPCWTSLPTGYSTIPYTFYSIAYQNGGQYYVLTYIPPPLTSNDRYGIGLLCLPGVTGGPCTNPPSDSTQLSVTFSDFNKQVRNDRNLSPAGYGTITAGILTTPSIAAPGAVPAPLTYPTPGVAIVPNGSLGIITQIVPCPATTCT